jgi:hypothetical protein
MEIHAIQDLSNNYVTNLLKNNLKEITKPELIQNYHPDYSETPGNLFNILANGRYDIGNYFVMEEDGKYAGSAGWNEFEDVVLLFTRAYIPPEKRRNYFLAKHLMPLMLKETRFYDKVWITCNEYNRSIYHGLEKLQAGQPAGLFDQWPEIYKKFVPIGVQKIYNTNQYVAEYRR